MKPIKHSPRKRTTFARKRQRSGIRVDHQLDNTDHAPPPPFRSPIQDEWPLTMCAELPLALGWYRAVN